MPRKKKPDTSVPLELNTPRFVEAWGSWMKYMAEKNRALAPSTQELHLNKLRKVAYEYGLESAIKSIEQSIDFGYRSVFPPIPDRLMKNAARAMTQEQMRERGLM